MAPRWRWRADKLGKRLWSRVCRNLYRDAERDPEILHQAPHTTSRRRFDEATAARKPVLTYQQDRE